MDTIPKIKHLVFLSKWAGLIQDCQMSGMTVQQWCATNNINVKTYYYWLKRVREQALLSLPQDSSCNDLQIKKNEQLAVNEIDKVSFKKLEVVSPVTNMQPAVIIRLPQASIEVTNDATQRTVEAVLLALRSVC